MTGGQTCGLSLGAGFPAQRIAYLSRGGEFYPPNVEPQRPQSPGGGRTFGAPLGSTVGLILQQGHLFIAHEISLNTKQSLKITTGESAITERVALPADECDFGAPRLRCPNATIDCRAATDAEDDSLGA